MSATILESARAAVETVRENPFPGLRPFREEEEHLFFGRESQVNRMVDKLAATRFLAVLGSSGSGKSSLVNCGLKPALHRGLMPHAGTNWRMVQFRPGSDPIRCMAQAFADEVDFFGGSALDKEAALGMLEATLKMSSLGVADLYEFARFEDGTNLLVIADQFEELFRFSRTQGQGGAAGLAEVNSDAVAFVNLLLEANAQQKYPIYVVLTMRSDFLGECSHFERLPEVMNESQYLVPRLTREERRAAISGPVMVTGAALSPVLLTRLVNDVGDDPAQLSIMQHAVNRTWAAWHRKTQGQGKISLEDYLAIGTMTYALDAHAEEAFVELADYGSETSARQALCGRVFKALTDRGTDARGIRRPLPMQRLCEVAGASAAEVFPVLAVFRDPSRSFLMPPLSEDLGPETTIDISHEILMRVWERLKRWADDEAQSAAIYRRLAETAELHRAERAELWRDRDLQTALEWQLKEKPNAVWAALYRGGFDAAMEFLAASKRVRDKERAEAEFERRWRRIAPVLAALSFAAFLYLSPELSKLIAALHPSPNGPAPVIIIVDIQTMWGRINQFTRDSKVIDGIGYSLGALLCFASYGGLAAAGKRGYRIIVFTKIEEEARGIRVKIAKVAPPVVATEALTYGGFWRRLGAGLINLIVLVCLMLLAYQLFNDKMTTSNRALFLWLAIPVLASYCYRIGVTFTRWAGTLGEVLCGIVVRGKTGARPSVIRTTIRFAVHLCLLLSILVSAVALLSSFASIVYRHGRSTFFTAMLALLVLLASYLIQVVTKRKQALHDLIAGTIVVRTKRSSKEQPTA